MALSQGTRLGVFEIAQLIGAGGMGEVYRARDTKLGRDVAIKVLPKDFAEDTERLERFEREAKMLAALDHPNIGALYDLCHEDDVRFLVLQLVEGESLQKRIDRAPTPVEMALPLFVQIAKALEAAHANNIIHRDLKPSNIQLSPDGTVKVLDFGLARPLMPVTRPPLSPTDTTLEHNPNDLTTDGSILGTPNFMSPEQTRGESLDTRSDIWALGCTLFATLTGCAPFEAETNIETMASILGNDPDWSALPNGLPESIQNLLFRCLEKDPRRRLSSAGDIAITLEDSAEALKRGSQKLSPAQAKEIPGHEPKIVRRFHCNLPPSLPYDSGLTVSPDARWIAYVTSIDGTRHLVLRQVDQLDARIISGTEGARRPFFSPDSKRVGFFSQTNTSLNKISVYGGTPITLCRNITLSLGACWGEDDHIAFSLGFGEGIYRIAAAGGTPERLTTIDQSIGERYHTFPQYLPGAKALLYTAATGSGVASSRVVALDLITGEEKTVAEGAGRPHFAPSGHVTFTQRGSISVAPFDVDRLEITGPIVPVTETQLVDAKSDFTHYAFSKDGLLVYAPMGAGTSGQSSRVLVWVDRKGAEEQIPAPPGPHFRIARVSPDGNLVLVGDARYVWSYDLEKATMSRLTFGQHSDTFPLWSPDGRRIAFSSNRDGQYNLYSKAVDGTGKEERLTESDCYQAPQSWSGDGKLLAYTEINADTGRSIGLLSLEGEPSSRLVMDTRFDERNPSISPDGRWLAYDCDESGRYEIYVQSLPDMTGKWQVTTEGGSQPLWSPDGRELFYRIESRMMAVSIETDPTFVPGNAKLLFEKPYYQENAGARSYDISPDGQRFLMIKEGGSAEDRRTQTELIVVENWFEELKRLAPVEGR